MPYLLYKGRNKRKYPKGAPATGNNANSDPISSSTTSLSARKSACSTFTATPTIEEKRSRTKVTNIAPTRR